MNELIELIIMFFRRDKSYKVVKKYKKLKEEIVNYLVVKIDKKITNEEEKNALKNINPSDEVDIIYNKLHPYSNLLSEKELEFFYNELKNIEEQINGTHKLKKTKIMLEDLIYKFESYK